MRITTKLLGLAGIIAAAVAIDRKRRLRAGAGVEVPAAAGGEAGAFATSDVAGADAVIVEAELVGISEVDPAGLTQMGEAIDPERTEAAHAEIPEQRERLPVRGKNVP